MARTIVNAAVGGLGGLVLLVMASAWWGDYHPVGELAEATAPSPKDAAYRSAIYGLAHYGWPAMAVGATVGGLTGLSIRLLRPRRV